MKKSRSERLMARPLYEALLKNAAKLETDYLNSPAGAFRELNLAIHELVSTIAENTKQTGLAAKGMSYDTLRHLVFFSKR